MRRFSRCLHTIRLELNHCGYLPSLTNFCPVPNSKVEKKKHVVISAPTSSTAGVVLHLATQQVRNYAPAAYTTLSDRACWNCQKIGRKNHMLCQSCGYLQDVDVNINYFDLLSFPNSFSLEKQELTRRFRNLQTQVHPDKYTNKSSREQNNSADWSALINKAYKTLTAPIERGQYLLRLQGEEIPEDNSALDKKFLMDMMDRNEEVEEANTPEELQRLSEDIGQQLNEGATELSSKFESNALSEAKSVLVKMKYLLRVQKSIKNKMQMLMGG